MRVAAAGLLLLGLLQMAGDLFVVPELRGVGAATAASPAPKVFSTVRGLETFSSRYFLEWIDRDGRQRSMEITPELYSKLRGPYNRRNIYGAVLAYGPVLASDPRTLPMFDSVASYALCGRAPLVRELGVDPSQIVGSVRVRLQPKVGTDTAALPTTLIPPCR